MAKVALRRFGGWWGGRTVTSSLFLHEVKLESTHNSPRVLFSSSRPPSCWNLVALRFASWRVYCEWVLYHVFTLGLLVGKFGRQLRVIINQFPLPDQSTQPNYKHFKQRRRGLGASLPGRKKYSVSYVSISPLHNLRSRLSLICKSHS